MAWPWVAKGREEVTERGRGPREVLSSTWSRKECWIASMTLCFSSTVALRAVRLEGREGEGGREGGREGREEGGRENEKIDQE